MTKDDEVLNKASEILSKFNVGESIVLLVDQWWKYQSTPDVEFMHGKWEKTADGEFIECDEKQKVPENLNTYTIVKMNGEELIVGCSSFHSSSAPDNYDEYADAYVYYDGDLVLHAGATKHHNDWGSVIRVDTYPFSIKVFKAGPWLERIGKCVEALESDHRAREEEKRQAKVAEQTSKIDLGDYE